MTTPEFFGLSDCSEVLPDDQRRESLTGFVEQQQPGDLDEALLAERHSVRQYR